MTQSLKAMAEQAARECKQKRMERLRREGVVTDVDKDSAETAAAIESVALKFAEAAIRGSFYTQRDDKAPGVWLFCKHRDEDGDETLQDNRLFPRHADAQKQIDQFVAAAISAAAAQPQGESET